MKSLGSTERVEFTAHQTKRPLLKSITDVKDKLIFKISERIGEEYKTDIRKALKQDFIND